MYKHILPGIVTALLLPSLVVAQSRSVTGFTKPSQEARLAFPQSGRIAEIDVEKGERVEKGQMLVRQDTSVEEERLEVAKLAADVKLRVDAAVQQAEQAGVEHERLRSIHGKGGVTDLEVERARLEHEIARIRVRLEEKAGAEAQAEVELQEAVIRQKQMTSPINGVVAEQEPNVGENVEPDDVVIHVVNNDPLRVTVRDLEAAAVRRLRVGDTLPVSYEGEEQRHEGRIVFISPVADRGTGLQPFELELANPENRAAGLRVQVFVPAGGGDDVAADARATGRPAAPTGR